MPDLSAFLQSQAQRCRDPLVWGDELSRFLAASSPAAATLADGGLGPIEGLVADPSISEIMINSPGPVWVERGGALEQSEVQLGAEAIDVLIERLIAPLGLRVDRLAPIADGTLPGGSRVSVVVPPVTDQPVVTIRTFPDRVLGLDCFGPPDLVSILRSLLVERATMVVVGATSSGKTSLLNALLAQCPPTERLVCIEDTPELVLDGPNRVRLEARPSNSEGVGGVTLEQLVRASLRMRPDRLVVGEVRGGEAFDLLLALSSGHRGSLATCHAGDPISAIDRLEALACLGHPSLGATTARRFIHQSVDAIVVVGRGEGNSRGVQEIRAVGTRGEAGVDRSETIWKANG